jgi:hypothetical protein
MIVPVRIAVVHLLMLTTLVGCGSPPVQCGGRVSPERLSEEARVILEKVKVDSVSYCAGDQVGCDFKVHKRPSGWVVGVIRSRGHEGTCLFQPGAHRVYVLDDEGAVVDVLGGI